MTLLTSADCLKKYGSPESEKAMTLWDVPKELEIGVIPKRLYCNRDMIKPLSVAFQNLIKTGLIKELKTFDGCFNIRRKKGGSTPSLHSWGVAIDVNAAWNGFDKKPILSAGFVKCFSDAGFDWGGHWATPDGMHFQLKKEGIA
ncbi:M15 family metallopeptidase [Moraxellaceae bacterium AER2_44_116]|nr:M15 family metallopeptidase [Moraxellaceae bacterium AER2_44_116]